MMNIIEIFINLSGIIGQKMALEGSEFPCGISACCWFMSHFGSETWRKIKLLVRNMVKCYLFKISPSMGCWVYTKN
jgi:hypothetical protein